LGRAASVKHSEERCYKDTRVGEGLSVAQKWGNSSGSCIDRSMGLMSRGGAHYGTSVEEELTVTQESG
jgi:hypothetical protein